MTLFDNIPQELKDLPQWVCASSDSKVPMSAYGNEAASSVNPETWVDFETARQVVEEGYYDYCGFVFTDNGYVGIDIDEGFDNEGFLSEMAIDIIGRCQSYTEKSKSGRGFHIIIKGDLPFKGRNNLQGVEIYKVSRYFIITGNVLLFDSIVEDQSAIDYVLERYFSESSKTKDKTTETIKATIYKPIWVKPATEGKISLRPTYPDIPQGSRNLCLTSLAGLLHTIGYSKTQIYNELSYANNKACKPPLSGGELQSICNSIVRYRR